MKKFFTITAVAIFLLSLTECKKPDPPLYTLAASVDASTIVQGMKDGNNQDYYTKDGNTPVQLNFLVYDDNGTLIYQSQKKIANFFESSSFSTDIDKGENCTVVVWACSYYNSNPTWISGDNSTLSGLVLSLNTYAAGIYAPMKPILGVSKTNVTISKTNNININVPTVGCFFTIRLNYASTTQASYALCISNKESSTYTINTGKSDFVTSADNSYEWYVEYDMDKQYGGIYSCYFTLPMSQTIMWGSFDSNDNMLKGGQFSFNAEAGKHQIFNVNIDTGVQSSSPATNNGRYESAGMQQVFNVSTMRAEPAKVATLLSKQLQ